MGLEVVLRQSASGLDIPVVRKDSREYPLHSRFDPLRESSRLHETSRHDGFLVILGLGFGYHVLPFLKNRDVTHIVIIEKDRPFIESLLALHDFRDILADDRVTLLVDPEFPEVQSFLKSSYVPQLSGAFSIVSLRSRYDLDRDYFAGVVHSLESALASISADVSVQSFFGRTWFSNGIRNLTHAAAADFSPVRGEKAIITAAGPSLELYGEAIRRRDPGVALIATDTSCPYLRACGVEPDFVISIDCQQFSVAHFVKPPAAKTVTVLDIFSSPTITRLQSGGMIFLNAHPFSELVARRLRRLPRLDTSGGNVTQAALSFAEWLCAREITIIGADYSYPSGKSYARDTYIYDLFRKRETRTLPLENQFYSFLFRSPDTRREYDGERRVYRTDVLDRYRDALYEKLGGCSVLPEKPGMPVHIYRAENSPDHDSVDPSRERGDVVRFLKTYEETLRSLPAPVSTMSSYLASMPHELKPWILSILPVAAWMSRHMECSPEELPVRSYIAARDWCTAFLSSYLTT